MLTLLPPSLCLIGLFKCALFSHGNKAVGFIVCDVRQMLFGELYAGNLSVL
jgi:hypothetical protein